MSELATLTLLDVDCAGLLMPTATFPLVFVGMDVICEKKNKNVKYPNCHSKFLMTYGYSKTTK